MFFLGIYVDGFFLFVYYFNYVSLQTKFIPKRISYFMEK